MTLLLGEVGLNIQEAHVFSTVDGYSLDVFVVDGWPNEVLHLYFFVEVIKRKNMLLIANIPNRLFTHFFDILDIFGVINVSQNTSIPSILEVFHNLL